MTYGRSVLLKILSLLAQIIGYVMGCVRSGVCTIQFPSPIELGLIQPARVACGLC